MMRLTPPTHAELDPIEIASRDEISALQVERLKTSLAHSYANVPLFKDRFDAAGVHPEDFHSLEDLAKFPFCKKQDLRDNYPFGMVAVPKSDIVRFHASSGTTGRATVVAYTQNDIDNWADLGARSIRACGGTRDHTVHVTYGYGLFTGGLGAHYGAERLGCAVVPMSGGQTERQVQVINDFGADIIMVTPSYMLAIAEEYERQGIDPRKSPLKAGIFGAEPWTNAMREQIEDRFDIDALDIYGLSEVMGPGVAVECLESKDGPVIWEDHFYPEIIDPDTGEVLPDGEQGELVFSSLTKEAFPVIRYRTGDLSRLLPGTSRSMRRMEKITGRTDDMLIIRGVNLFPSQVEELVVQTGGLSAHYVLEVRREGALDTLTVRVERDLSATPDDATAKELQHRIKGVLGVSAAIDICEPGSIDRSLGKAKRVLDLRKI
ncbi:phenylacetate--CoA ligase [Sneathiella marina]|uniref:Phenylacetate-coenzyme A ligase n=2 Tax=Sneathiella marina TaxID=2950108 RepID=A0ABY4W1F7_9PROT|nr:phenylacetate--CoA ligase PaaK [Sneathiella marina]USG59672.1 phenylacetate--CoA ligase [Sneathiella marina]